MSDTEFKFIDLFAGIGGFHLAMHRNNMNCVFASEIDSNARKTYIDNFKSISPHLFKNNLFNDDILKLDTKCSEIPEFDILCAGFPCQPFSQAGYKRGFGENFQSRGNMFFEICHILRAKRPKAFILENVRHLLNHDNGKTFSRIQAELKDLKYRVYHKIIKASDFGLPQHRARIFIVGFREEEDFLYPFEFPKTIPLEMTMSDIFKGDCTKKIGHTLRVGGRKSPIDDRRNWDGYWVDGIERRLNVDDAKKMMGYPEDFTFKVSETQAMKQLGNSVAVPVVQAIGESVNNYLNNMMKRQELVVNLEKGIFVLNEK